MEDMWGFKGFMEKSLAMLTVDLKEWNKSVYGDITTRKRNVLQKFTII